MLKVEGITVDFINERDLNFEGKKLPIDEIRFNHIKDKKIIMKSDLLILNKDGDQRVLKSKY